LEESLPGAVTLRAAVLPRPAGETSFSRARVRSCQQGAAAPRQASSVHFRQAGLVGAECLASLESLARDDAISAQFLGSIQATISQLDQDVRQG
jgi:hypothetical protein